MKSERAVSLEGGVIVKRGDPQKIAIEAAKMQAAAIVGRESGLFQVPAIVDLDAERGVLRMEYVPGIRGIRRFRGRDADLVNLMRHVGEALAAIHMGLRLPDSMRRPLAGSVPDCEGAVYLHGDFSGENVCVLAEDGERPRLIILDWQTSLIAGGEGTYGTPYFDVAWFVGNLFRKPVYKYLSQPDPAVAADSFIDAYSAIVGDLFDRQTFSIYLSSLLQFRQRVHESELLWIKRLLLAHGFVRWGRYAVSRVPKRNVDARLS